ncbi:DUF3077 domain-containing protein [Pseudomonas sp. GD03944]|uniref:DUF3077 domain-containing protein n=1 Tax=Pseudomonas sp. GD03944 TaxID=2975409 RepID=UPI00244912FD|nr:DUF3077 domain-containing protein [Pseudomonas sp. GD03944]MDH1261579.1 DUF3077 domain-containing protein [Pseudomonas sp. GD03944]
MTDHHAHPAPPLTTTSATFHPCNAARQPLFAVLPGVPVADALDSVYCLLDVAEELTIRMSDAADPNREQLGHACTYLMEMAKATVRTCIEGLDHKA